MELLVVALCILLNALLACVEMAFVSVSRPQLRDLAQRGISGAKIALELRRRPERTLSVLQIGITSLGALAAAVGGAGTHENVTPLLASSIGLSQGASEALALVIMVVPLAYLSVVGGELVPKSIAMRQPLRIVVVSARWLALVDRLLAPIVTLLELSTRTALHLLFRTERPSSAPEAHADGQAVQLQELSRRHRQYVVNLLEIEQKRVSEVMLPWSKVAHVRTEQDWQEVQEAILTSGHTRLPIVRGSEIVGLLHTKEFVTFHSAGGEQWSLLIRPIVRLAADTSILEALRILQDARSHMAIVTSHSATLGIITLEDVFEAVVGEIHDEADDGLAQSLLIRKPARH